ncbi:helix-turn-helix transcriptional regulator [Paenarthrobacter ureafaciens]|uniref:helix-turn-helix transcriptional regulator n=1 Tax=Paenarthrobacter TaxID=1742992 RepID=UPI00223275D4|nr:helix-turn-helix transcriptional regulator [Paenarthrobacter sp. PAE-2]MCW3765246.1 helix-turn-helix transcriptional regulator [Paenarthrobacter sp. PAE-2]
MTGQGNAEAPSEDKSRPADATLPSAGTSLPAAATLSAATSSASTALPGGTAAVRELLLALSAGFSLRSPLPDNLAGRGDLPGIIAAATDAQLLMPDGSVVGTVQHALLTSTPVPTIHALQRELVDKLAAEGRPLGELARDLARGGLQDHRVAAELEEAADNALETEPAVAAALYAESVLAGAKEMPKAACRAQAAAGIGDLDSAGRLIDRLLALPEPPDVRRGVDVAASVWAQRGMMSRSADTYSWLGPGKTAASAPLAAIAMIGSGDAAGAEAMVADCGSRRSPTHLAVALSLASEGLRQTLGQTPHLGLPSLIRASDMMNAAGTALPLPEAPAVLAALCALHSGETAVAASVLKAAVAAGQGGDSMRPRLYLLQAWCAMQQDNTDDARLAINEANKANHWALAPREEFLLAALELGLARRGGEVHELVLAWDRAREAMMHVSVDLYSLLPWGEVLVTAARLRESHRVSHYLHGAWDLLERLGNPPLWSVPLHWAAVQAALLSESPADLAPHAAALVRASEHSHYAGVLADGGKAWVSVLAGRFAAADVETAARGLAAVGMPWEGARLAGHAAARADERRDMVKLLACARDIHPQGGQAPAETHEESPASAAPAPEPNGLSAREIEVARLMLEGKTYREIGEAIYISPRTAEHHVARMRRRLGAENRSELLVRLRIALGEGHPPGE